MNIQNCSQSTFFRTITEWVVSARDYLSDLVSRCLSYLTSHTSSQPIHKATVLTHSHNPTVQKIEKALPPLQVKQSEVKKPEEDLSVLNQLTIVVNGTKPLGQAASSNIEKLQKMNRSYKVDSNDPSFSYERVSELLPRVANQLDVPLVNTILRDDNKKIERPSREQKAINSILGVLNGDSKRGFSHMATDTGKQERQVMASRFKHALKGLLQLYQTGGPNASKAVAYFNLLLDAGWECKAGWEKAISDIETLILHSGQCQCNACSHYVSSSNQDPHINNQIDTSLSEIAEEVKTVSLTESIYAAHPEKQGSDGQEVHAFNYYQDQINRKHPQLFSRVFKDDGARSSTYVNASKINKVFEIFQKKHAHSLVKAVAARLSFHGGSNQFRSVVLDWVKHKMTDEVKKKQGLTSLSLNMQKAISQQATQLIWGDQYQVRSEFVTFLLKHFSYLA